MGKMVKRSIKASFAKLRLNPRCGGCAPLRELGRFEDEINALLVNKVVNAPTPAEAPPPQPRALGTPRDERLHADRRPLASVTCPAVRGRRVKYLFVIRGRRQVVRRCETHAPNAVRDRSSRRIVRRCAEIQPAPPAKADGYLAWALSTLIAPLCAILVSTIVHWDELALFAIVRPTKCGRYFLPVRSLYLK